LAYWVNGLIAQVWLTGAWYICATQAYRTVCAAIMGKDGLID